MCVCIFVLYVRMCVVSPNLEVCNVLYCIVLYVCVYVVCMYKTCT